MSFNCNAMKTSKDKRIEYLLLEGTSHIPHNYPMVCNILISVRHSFKIQPVLVTCTEDN